MKIGFNTGESKKEELKSNIENPAISKKKILPIRSVVTVRFENGKEYPYYNDEFDLKIGDVVYVDGKLAGKAGRVIDVTRKFKVSLDFYKRVLAKLNLELHGEFERVNGFMLCRENAASFEQVNAWLNPPVIREKEEEFFIGDGYEVALDKINKCPEITECEYDDATELYLDGEVKFISVKNGSGKAIVKNRGYHTVDFSFKNGMAKNLYCDCISPNFCKHMIAVCFALQMLRKESNINEDTDFCAFSQGLFYDVVSYSSGKMVL